MHLAFEGFLFALIRRALVYRFQEDQPNYCLRGRSSKSTSESVPDNVELFTWSQADKPSYPMFLKKRRYNPIYWLQKCLMLTVYAFGLYGPSHTVRLFTRQLLSTGRVAVYGENSASKCSSEEALSAMDHELQHVVNKIKDLL